MSLLGPPPRTTRREPTLVQYPHYDEPPLALVILVPLLIALVIISGFYGASHDDFCQRTSATATDCSLPLTPPPFTWR